MKVGRVTHETPPLFFFPSMNASYPPSKPCTPSLLSIDSVGLAGLPPPFFPELDDGGDPAFCGPSLKICTVSCAELTASKLDTTLKLMEYILASLVPLLNWYSFSAPGVLHTRMTVPLSEAVARSVPVELIERNEMGDLCAWITLDTVKERVENRRTSPDWEAVGVVGGGAACEADCVANVEVAEGTGEGYARYELSADGERAHIAAKDKDIQTRRYCVLGIHQ